MLGGFSVCIHSIWFVIFKGRMGSRFYGYGMVERKCICVSGVFSVMLNNIKYIRSFIMPKKKKKKK